MSIVTVRLFDVLDPDVDDLKTANGKSRAPFTESLMDLNVVSNVLFNRILAHHLIERVIFLDSVLLPILREYLIHQPLNVVNRERSPRIMTGAYEFLRRRY